MKELKNYLPPYHSVSLHRRKKFRRLGSSVGEHWQSPDWGKEGSLVAALQSRGLTCAGVSRLTAWKAERNCSWAKSLHALKGWIVAEIGSPPSKCCLQHLPLHCAGTFLWQSICSLTELIVRLGLFIVRFAFLFTAFSQARDDLCACRCVYVDGSSVIQLLTILNIWFCVLWQHPPSSWFFTVYFAELYLAPLSCVGSVMPVANGEFDLARYTGAWAFLVVKSEFCFPREYQSLQYHWWCRHVHLRVLYPILQSEGTEKGWWGCVEKEIGHHDFTCFLFCVLLIVSPPQYCSLFRFCSVELMWLWFPEGFPICFRLHNLLLSVQRQNGNLLLCILRIAGGTALAPLNCLSEIQLPPDRWYQINIIWTYKLKLLSTG